MPRYQGILAGGHIRQRKLSIRISHHVIRIFHGKPPAFHVGMEATLHDEEPTVLRHLDDFDHRLSGQMIMTFGPGITHMQGIHRKRCVE